MIAGIGPKSNAMLAQAGIHSREDLLRLGAVGAFLQVKAAGGTPSLNFLWGLESVISGRPWQEIARQDRTALLLELEERSQPRR